MIFSRIACPKNFSLSFIDDYYFILVVVIVVWMLGWFGVTIEQGQEPE